MSSPVKAPKKKKPRKVWDPHEKSDKKIKESPEAQNKPDEVERRDQKDEPGNQNSFENEPLKGEDIDSLFML